MDNQMMPNYPVYDPQTGLPFSQTQGTSLIESQESKLIEWIMNPDNVIRQLENTLRGIRVERRWDNELNDFKEEVVQESEPMLNDVGIRGVIRIVRGYLTNPAFSTTDFEEDNIIEMSLVFGEEFMEQILLCYEEWELRYENIGMLKNLIFDIIYATLLRSKNGHLIDYITQSYSEKYISGSGLGGAPRKKGVFGKLFGAYA
jgi:hypothetical protein